MAEEFTRKKIKWATKCRRGGSRVWKTKIVKVRKKQAK